MIQTSNYRQILIIILLVAGAMMAACIPGNTPQPPPATPTAVSTRTPTTSTPQPAATPSPTAEPAGNELAPAATAARLSFLGWSPDGETVAYLEHTPADLAVLGPFPPGTLKFLQARTGQTCDSAIIFPEGDYDRSAQISWLPDGRLLVNSNGQRVEGTPCSGNFTEVTAADNTEAVLPDASLSPQGGHRAGTVIRENSGGILNLVTTIIDAATGQEENVIEWKIDERLGDLDLGGEWLNEDKFLIYETLDQGPLLATVGAGVSQIAMDLFGLPDVPSILDPEGVSLRAAAAAVAGADNYHIALAGVGSEANFPPVRLYHSETGQVEEVPFQYLGWPAFSPDGRWLVLNAHPLENGYETFEVWLRPVDPADSEARRLISRISGYTVWSPNWSKVAVETSGGISILSIPDGAGLGSWGGGDYTLNPLVWSPDSRFLAVHGSLRYSSGEGLFIIQASE